MRPGAGQMWLIGAGLSANIGIQWLIVREHPDDPEVFVIIPCDDIPLMGTPDCKLTPHGESFKVTINGQTRQVRPAPFVARCGNAIWVNTKAFDDAEYLWTISAEDLVLVRRTLGRLAAGKLTGDREQRSTDCDPEYEDCMNEIARVRERLSESC